MLNACLVDDLLLYDDFFDFNFLDGLSLVVGVTLDVELNEGFKF
jgi:hypothetical protein